MRDGSNLEKSWEQCRQNVGRDTVYKCVCNEVCVCGYVYSGMSDVGSGVAYMVFPRNRYAMLHSGENMKIWV